jgi:hypothetical protein
MSKGRTSFLSLSVVLVVLLPGSALPQGGDNAVQIEATVNTTPAPYMAGKGSGFAQIAALDCDIAAGPGQNTKITTRDEHAKQIRWVSMPKNQLRAPARFYRWLRVRGESMAPVYPDHSWVLVNFLRHDPHHMKEKPVVVWLERNKGCTLTILQERKELPAHWILHALNPAADDSYVEKTEPSLQFAAVEAAWQQIE